MSSISANPTNAPSLPDLKVEQLLLYCHGAGGGAVPFHGAGGGAVPFHGAGGGAVPLAITTDPFAGAVTAVRKPIAPTRTSITARTTKLSLNIVPPKDRCFRGYSIHPDFTGQAMEERISVFGCYPPSLLRLAFAWRIGLSLLHAPILQREREGGNSTRVLRRQDFRRRWLEEGAGPNITKKPGARRAPHATCGPRSASNAVACQSAKTLEHR